MLASAHVMMKVQTLCPAAWTGSHHSLWTTMEVPKQLAVLIALIAAHAVMHNQSFPIRMSGREEE